MSYLISIFDAFFRMTTTIQIPIPLTTNNYIMIPLFAIIYAFIIFGILFFVIGKLFNFEFSFANYMINHYSAKAVHGEIDKYMKDREGEKRTDFIKDKRNKKEKK